jgi:UDP-N-acetylmuramate--alanine ligase
MLHPVKNQKILMMGIGGIGVSALARLYKDAGAIVSGCDLHASYLLKTLEREGITILSENEVCVQDYTRIIHTHAIPETHPILMEAHKQKIPVLERGAALAQKLCGKGTVAITGSHGKTTLTFLIGTLLTKAGRNPTVCGGGIDHVLDSNYRSGSEETFVAEMDESEPTFLKARPQVTLISNLDHEHVDAYPTKDHLVQTFSQFLSHLPSESTLVIYAEDQTLLEISRKYFCGKRLITCGLNSAWDYVLKEVHESKNGLSLQITGPKKTLHCQSPLLGLHNAMNITLASACAHACGLSDEEIELGIPHFFGVKRRLEILQKNHARYLVTDYAHHPTEIQTVFSTLHKCFPTQPLVAIFEAHRLTRISAFMEGFVKTLASFDCVILADVHSAGESGDAETLLSELREKIGKEKCMRVKNSELYTHLQTRPLTDEIQVLLSAGNLDEVIRKKIHCENNRGDTGF